MRRKPRVKRDEVMHFIYSQRGLAEKIAAACFISPTSIAGWPRVPAARVQMVAAILQLMPEDIRPDIFLVPNARRQSLPRYVLEAINDL